MPSATTMFAGYHAMIDANTVAGQRKPNAKRAENLKLLLEPMVSEQLQAEAKQPRRIVLPSGKIVEVQA
jgi:hypothetical protein